MHDAHLPEFSPKHSGSPPGSRPAREPPLTQLVGELLAHDGGGGAEARQHRHGEGGADGQPVDEVVQRVAQRDHPRHRPDVGDLLPAQPVAHHAGAVLEEQQRASAFDPLDATETNQSNRSSLMI